ncbi:MAG: hypothetical protein ACM3UW_01585 [Bacillota bacterium]
MSLGKRIFLVVFLALLAWCLSLPPPASALENPPQWHTLKTLSGDTQVYGYTKDTSFGEIVVECDPDTDELAGHAYLNAYIGEEERLVGIEEETYLGWENPRTLNFLECQILAPNIPSSVDLDIEYHWEHPEEIMHYKPGPPIWPGNPSWALLAPEVPNKMLVVVKATNPNPYPISAVISGVVLTYTNDLGIFFPAAEPVLEFRPKETRYLMVSHGLTDFVTETNNPLSGTSGYSSAAGLTNSYQILAEDYPPSWIINGSTTVDVPPYGRINGMYEQMSFHPSYQHPPEEVPTPFNLAVKRNEPNWTKNVSTASMLKVTGSRDMWEGWYYPHTASAVVTDPGRDMNRYYMYRSDTQIPMVKGWDWDSKIHTSYWWPYNDGWNSYIPVLTNDPETNSWSQVWFDNYSFVPDRVTPPYVPPRDDGCGGTIPGYQPPDILMDYGTLTSTPIILQNTYRTLEERPAIKNQIVINACIVDVVNRINSDYSCNPVSTTKTRYTWNGSGFTSVQTTTPYAGETAGTGNVLITLTNMVQAISSGHLSATIGRVTSGDCSGSYTFEATPQEIHLPKVSQLDAMLQEHTGLSLPVTIYTPPYVPGYVNEEGKCVPGYQPPDEIIYSLPSDVTINSIVIPAGQTTTLLAEQKTINIPLESAAYNFNINGLATVLNAMSTADEVIFPNSITVSFEGADPAQAHHHYRNWNANKKEWRDSYSYGIMGPGPEVTASSYYSSSNPYRGYIKTTLGPGKWYETFPKYVSSNNYFSYYRVLLNGSVFPNTWDP